METPQNASEPLNYQQPSPEHDQSLNFETPPADWFDSDAEDFYLKMDATRAMQGELGGCLGDIRSGQFDPSVDVPALLEVTKDALEQLSTVIGGPELTPQIKELHDRLTQLLMDPNTDIPDTNKTFPLGPELFVGGPGYRNTFIALNYRVAEIVRSQQKIVPHLDDYRPDY